MVTYYKYKLLRPDSPDVNRALAVYQRLFFANKHIPGVSAIKWKLTVIDAELVNAFALPVNFKS